jgi:hypothetical protein
MAKRPKTYMDYYLNVMKKAVTRITVVMIIVKKPKNKKKKIKFNLKF